MPRRCILIVLLPITVFLMARPADLSAGEQYGWIGRRYHGPVPYYVGNPKRVDPAQSAAVGVFGDTTSYYLQQRRDASPHAYPYGYFGAQYRPYSVWHSNYYNDYIQWSFSRGY